MTSRISAEGIKVFAFHGCLEAESKIGGEFVVDVTVDYHFGTAAETDSLKDTVDYCLIAEVVRQEMSIRSKLIETVATRILLKLKNNISVKTENIKVRITKLNPPINSQIEKVWVEIEG